MEKKPETRWYGDGATIHHTSQLDVEVDKNGKVVAVWFRCQPFAFRQVEVDDARADDMRTMYKQSPMPEIRGFRLKDPV